MCWWVSRTQLRRGDGPPRCCVRPPPDPLQILQIPSRKGDRSPGCFVCTLAVGGAEVKRKANETK
eukprot:8435161-Pyramimonas_sp.AAC.2